MNVISSATLIKENVYPNPDYEFKCKRECTHSIAGRGWSSVFHPNTLKKKPSPSESLDSVWWQGKLMDQSIKPINFTLFPATNHGETGKRKAYGIEVT